VTRAAPPEVVLLGDHPSLHRGFARVVREVARFLGAQTGWRVRVVGYYPPVPGWTAPGYPVTALDERDDPRPARVPKLERWLRSELRPREPEAPVLVSIGTLFDLECVVRAVERAGLRSRVRLVGYTPLDSAPVPAPAARLFDGLDALIPFTRFAKRAVEECARRAGLAPAFLGEPIPHGVDTERFRPMAPGERAEQRRALFGLGDAERLVGYFGRNSGNKRADVVLRLFHLAASGRYIVCRRCGNTGACRLDRNGRPAELPARCPACSCPELSPGRSRDDAVLYLHTDLGAHETGAASGGRDLLRIADSYGIRDRVRLRPDIRIGRGDDEEELARRMGACDVHVLPFECAGWELTVLETGACGVANVITEVAAPPEYAAPFSRVVPVGSWVLEDDLRGLVDTDLALRAIVELLDDPAARRQLAAQGPPTAKCYDWHAVGSLWVEALTARLAAWRSG
jgi:glycosyltransferase involved in cell wall biosynthesis